MPPPARLNWLEKLINLIEISPDYIIGPTYGKLNKKTFDFISETTAHSGQAEILKTNQSEEIYISGWFLCGTKQTFNKLIPNGCDGPFDSKSFFVYYEDSDLGLRAVRSGVQLMLYYVPVHHLKKQTSRLLNTSQLYLSAKEKFIEKWKNKVS